MPQGRYSLSAATVIGASSARFTNPVWTAVAAAPLDVLLVALALGALLVVNASLAILLFGGILFPASFKARRGLAA